MARYFVRFADGRQLIKGDIYYERTARDLADLHKEKTGKNCVVEKLEYTTVYSTATLDELDKVVDGGRAC